MIFTFVRWYLYFTFFYFYRIRKRSHRRRWGL